MSNMVVRTNVFALNAHRNMKNVGMDQSRAANRLSSGYRINSAADDAAGLAISENMRAQIRGLDQASRNTQDGQAMLLTTEGGLEEIGNMLQQVRELMVKASSDTNTQDQRGLIEQEIAQLGREIISLQNRVEFNTNRVLSRGPVMDNAVISAASSMAIGAHNMNIVGGVLAQALRDTQAALDLVSEVNAGFTIATGGAIYHALRTADTSPAIANFGTLQSGNLTGTANVGWVLGGAASTTAISSGGVTRLSGISVPTNTAGTIRANLIARVAQITTAIANLQGVQGHAMRTSFTTQHGNVRQFVNSASSNNNIAFFQVGANASQGINFDFETVSRAVSTAGWTVTLLAPAMSAASSGSGIGQGARISPFISALDDSIDDISRVRANLGAVQNRMDYTMRSLDISSENLQDSESRVRNADIAKEMMAFTMSNVLQQAAVSMLAQANQAPQNLLQLLR